MRNLTTLVLLFLILASCQKKVEIIPIQPLDWSGRTIELLDSSVTHSGKNYLPVYSHIYHMHEHRTFDLTTTVSIRNITLTDTVYIIKADYYNTVGDHIRSYVTQPVFVKPMETLEIIIAEKDNSGGSGANFLFEWASKNSKIHPLFEAVMISTYGQQGLSFTTRGVEVAE